MRKPVGESYSNNLIIFEHLFAQSSASRRNEAAALIEKDFLRVSGYGRIKAQAQLLNTPKLADLTTKPVDPPTACLKVINFIRRSRIKSSRSFKRRVAKTTTPTHPSRTLTRLVASPIPSLRALRTRLANNWTTSK